MPILELVSPIQELPDYAAPYPGDTSLADRVAKSYALALILVHSPYTQNNANSLESLRSWARENFQRQPDFLHPSSLVMLRRSGDTVFGALGYNLFAQVHYWLQEMVGELLKFQIARFHDTTAYATFNVAYFDIFGKDAEAATLLARYQSDRAKTAIDVVLWSIAWLGAVIWSVFHLCKTSPVLRHERLQRVLAVGWTLISTEYFLAAWTNNDFESGVSSLLGLAIALFLFRPTILSDNHFQRRQLVQIKLGRKWVCVTAWITFTLLAVQILTWIRSGLPNSPDPVTLLLCSLNGNFIHDPVHAKRLIMQLLGVAWLLVTGWTLRVYLSDQPQRPRDAEIRSLATSYSVD
jgi:hypothetical protein